MHFNKKKIIFPTIKINSTTSSKKTKKISEKKDAANVSPRSNNKKKRVKIIKHAGDNNLNKKDSDNYKTMEEWSGKIKDTPIFVLGNGPSLEGADLKILDNYFTIGINRIFFIYDPIILIWQDIDIWNEHKRALVNQNSIKVCTIASDPRNLFTHYQRHKNPFRFTSNSSQLYGSGNTGILAVELAVSLGCSSVILLGMDCSYSDRGKTDFYGRNKHHKPYTIKMCESALIWLKNNCPIPIYNCSNNRFWPKRNIEDVIKEVNPPLQNREYYLGIFKK